MPSALPLHRGSPGLSRLRWECWPADAAPAPSFLFLPPRQEAEGFTKVGAAAAGAGNDTCRVSPEAVFPPAQPWQKCG